MQCPNCGMKLKDRVAEVYLDNLGVGMPTTVNTVCPNCKIPVFIEIYVKKVYFGGVKDPYRLGKIDEDVT